MSISERNIELISRIPEKYQEQIFAFLMANFFKFQRHDFI